MVRFLVDKKRSINIRSSHPPSHAQEVSSIQDLALIVNDHRVGTGSESDHIVKRKNESVVLTSHRFYLLKI